MRIKLLKNNIYLRHVKKITNLFASNLYFNFLGCDSFFIYVNDLNNVLRIIDNKLQLFSLSYKGFFINTEYLRNLNLYFQLYSKNYLAIMQYMILFINIYLNII